MKTFLLTTTLIILSAGLAYADHHAEMAVEEAPVMDAEAPPENAKADILGADGAVIGEATFVQGSIGVLANIKAANLPAGKHGLHLHAMGTCDHADHFKSASGHINPDEKEHGYLNANGPDKGDLPNLIVHTDGTAEVELFLPQVDVADLMDEDGSSLMIHANPDDHTTQPIGGAGDRIACGVITKNN